MRGRGLDDLIKGLVGNDTLFGLGGDDTIRGGSGNDLIRGNAGNDIISGDKSRDKLFGQDGNDKLIGAGGDDVLRGGKGNDLLAGGEGADLFLASNNAGRDKIPDFAAEDAMDFRSLGLALSDLTILETSKGEAVINYGGSSGFRLIGVSVADLTLENFLFFGDDVPDTPATAEPLAIGETRRASIDFADDTNVFALNVVAGNTSTFAAESDGALPVANPRVRLVDENGDPIPLDGTAPNTVPGLILGFTAERSETVFLEVDAPGDSTGLYDVFSILTNEVDDFADNDTTTGLLSPGTVINGSPERPGDSDRFLFDDVPAGSGLVVEIQPTSPGPDGANFTVTFMNAIETSISTAVAPFNNTNFVHPLSDQDLDESAHFTVSGGDDLTGLPVD